MIVLAIATPSTIAVTLTLSVVFIAAAAWFVVFVVRKLNARSKR